MLINFFFGVFKWIDCDYKRVVLVTPLVVATDKFRESR